MTFRLVAPLIASFLVASVQRRTASRAEAHDELCRLIESMDLGSSKNELALREAIRCCRNGGVVSVIGVYGGFIDTFPMGAVVNRSLTIKSGQCHVHRYLRPLLERIERGEIDPSFVITHSLPLSAAAEGYDLFLNNRDGCEKVVLKAA